ncbi:hypothetical protein JMN32_20355 [Fulvivirga sp. 29W222]|uniref:DUF1735 domain-containing protein n=1 Tax=Fulvivirga marina TaxID=2494733 RepID=A0A937G5A1_9BACT|nr:hypothetical protein [Fulvivirga marina]MBL6448676.1 hypothetical protein [Fulvivirga marina]
MKKYLPFFLLLTGSLLYSACSSDDVEDLTTITIDSDLKQSFEVSVAETGPTTISTEKTFDATSDAQILDFGNKISAYQMDSLTLEFKSYVGAADINLNNASLSIKKADGSNLGSFTLIPSSNIQEINLKEFDDNNVVITITFDDASTQAISDAFLADNKISIAVSASVDGQPADFTVETVLYLKVSGSLAG